MQYIWGVNEKLKYYLFKDKVLAKKPNCVQNKARIKRLTKKLNVLEPPTGYQKLTRKQDNKRRFLKKTIQKLYQKGVC